MFKQIACFFVVVFAMYSAVRAGDRGVTLSPLDQQVVSIVEAAYAYVQEHSDDMDGVQKALMTDPRFRDDTKALHIFIHAYNAEKGEAICCGQGAEPQLIGKNMWNLRTPNGRLLFHEIYEMMNKTDKWWLEYEWLHPVSKKIQIKRSYFMKIMLKDGRKAVMGCGYWK